MSTEDPLLFSTDHFRCVQSALYPVPGYLIVHCEQELHSLNALSPSQQQELMSVLARAEALLESVLAPERVYLMKYGEALPRLHFHVVARTATLGRRYEAEGGERAPYNGARFVEWLWRRAAELDQRDALIEFVATARRTAN